MSTEEWRKIPGYDAQYEVSNFGEVRSWGPVAQGRKLATRVASDGFPRVRMFGPDGKIRPRRIHLLVAAAFPEGEK
ncbi:NUMOD4 domain-containing protein [Streptomyces sp. NPDC051639]|uniref:NUMOD4 domain-containing protein n=1 Tax=Streptomyces sp. NPDC051639 TaxID=3155671 RepID=UPI00344A86CD